MQEPMLGHLTVLRSPVSSALDPQPLDPQSLHSQLFRNDIYLLFQTRIVFALFYAHAVAMELCCRAR